MAKKSASAKPEVNSPTLKISEFRLIDLSKIIANSAQSRGMGVLPNCEAQGYGIFQSKTKGKLPLWEGLLSNNEEERSFAITKIMESDPDIVGLSESLEQIQLQPIGVLDLDGEYDVIYGMRRALAQAFNWATSQNRKDKDGNPLPCYPKQIEAKIYSGDISEVELKFMALQENDDRKEESPIDRAYTYAWFGRVGKLKEKEIAERLGVSEATIRRYKSLLSAGLVDRRMDIHEGKLSVDRAIKILEDLEKGGKKEEEEGKEGNRGPENRHRFPSAKTVQRLYSQGYKDDDMSNEEWELYTLDDSRRYIAYYMGLKYTEFKEKEKPAKIEKTPAVQKGKGKKILSITKKKAVNLLISLGKTNARTFKKTEILEMLNDISKIADANTSVETDVQQKLLDKLLSGEYTVELKKEIPATATA